MRSRVIFTLVFILVFSLTSNVYASGVNVCTHAVHGWDVDNMLTTAKQMDSEWIRDEIIWRYVEWEKGSLSMPNTATWVTKAVNKGMKPLCILGYGNGAYQEGNDEYTNLHLPTLGTKSGTAAVKEKQYWDAWMNYVSFVATTYKGKIKAYEIWNEPNHKGFNDNVNANNYAKLYIETRKVIKEIDPDAIVLCGAIAGADQNFMDSVLAYIQSNGGLSQIDAFSIHFYAHGSTPEGEYLSNLNNTYASVFKLRGYTGPIWMTENGAYSGTAENSVSERVQAAYAIRFPVIFDSFLARVKTTGENVWYDLKNDGTDLTNSEHNYGLTYDDFSAKPAYKAAKTLNKVINGMKLVNMDSTSDNYVAEYSDGVSYSYVIWTTKSTKQNVTVDIKGNVTKVYSMEGNVIDEFSAKGLKTFEVTSEPTLIYSSNKKSSLSANTVINYSSTNKKICISGEIDNFMDEQDISFLVVPHGTELSNDLNPELIGYIGTITVKSNSFYHSFCLPSRFCGEADVYVGGLKLDNNISAQKSIPENKFMYIAKLDVDKSSMSASAIYNNFTSEDKEANVIVAGYKDGRLIDVKSEVIKADANTYQSTEFKTAGFTLGEVVDEVKAFVWDSMQGLVPLAPAINK